MAGLDLFLTKLVVHRVKDKMKQKPIFYFLIIFTSIGLICLLLDCAPKEKTLIVYAAHGLKKPMEDIKKAFEQKYNKNIKIDIICSGSDNLLRTIQKTQKGDVFIPATVNYLKDAGSLIASQQYVASYRALIAIHEDNPKDIHSFNDLAKPGVRLAIGDKEMCSIGRISEKIIGDSILKESLMNNIVIKTSTVEKLLSLLINKEVDAVIIWDDLLAWVEAEKLIRINLPSNYNERYQIHAAVLSTAEEQKAALLLMDFLALEGKALFVKNGFSPN